MLMISYEKHLKYFKQTFKQLNELSDDDLIRIKILELMHYLDKNHLLDKNSLEHKARFLACEVNLDKLKDVSAEVLLSFLTTIYRIDYIDANSDAFMIYYHNQMLTTILKELISKLEIVIKSKTKTSSI